MRSPQTYIFANINAKKWPDTETGTPWVLDRLMVFLLIKLNNILLKSERFSGIKTVKRKWIKYIRSSDKFGQMEMEWKKERRKYCWTLYKWTESLTARRLKITTAIIFRRIEQVLGRAKKKKWNSCNNQIKRVKWEFYFYEWWRGVFTD